MVEQSEYKKTLVLDFDGVIHSYTSGWRGAAVIPDAPVQGAFTAIELYLDHFKVAIYSSRSSQLGGVEAMREWFVKHGFNRVGELEFPSQKPAAWLTIDDRAHRFDGVFPSVSAIASFTPWYAK